MKAKSLQTMVAIAIILIVADAFFTAVAELSNSVWAALGAVLVAAVSFVTTRLAKAGASPGNNSTVDARAGSATPG